MSESSNSNFESTNTRTRTRSWLFTPFFAIVLPVVVATVLYRLDPLEPVPIPVNEMNRSPLVAPTRNENMRRGAEAVAVGHVAGPEDLVYDAASGVLYTGCEDGWIKRVTLNELAPDSVVENWVNTGGRPLGLAFQQNGELIVADADKVTPFHIKHKF